MIIYGWNGYEKTDNHSLRCCCLYPTYGEYITSGNYSYAQRAIAGRRSIYRQKLFPRAWKTMFGDYLLIVGLILSELLLFEQGVFSYFGVRLFSNYFLILSMVSALMHIGILLVLISVLTHSYYVKTQSPA